MDESKFLRYKDLEIGFSNKFQMIWDTSKNGSDHESSYFTVPVEDDFYPLGHYVRPGKESMPGPDEFMIVVRDHGKALAPPVDYELVWYITADWPCGFWVPKPPPGYVAMGMVVATGKNADGSYVKPSLDAVRCVASEYAVSAKGGSWVWDDSGSHADKDVTVWTIVADDGNGGNEAWIAPGNFYTNDSGNQPTNHPLLWALRIKVAPPIPPPPSNRPVLNSHDGPSPLDDETSTSEYEVPFFLVNDPALSTGQKLANSPMYKIRMTRRYVFLEHEYNDTSRELQRTWRLAVRDETSKMDSFTHTIGISTTFGTGQASPVTATVTISYQFSYQTSTTVTHSEETTHEIPIVIAPGKSTAAWYVSRTIQLFRSDGSQVGQDLVINDPESIYVTEFPKDTPAQPAPSRSPSVSASSTEGAGSAGHGEEMPAEDQSAESAGEPLDEASQPANDEDIGDADAAPQE